MSYDIIRQFAYENGIRFELLPFCETSDVTTEWHNFTGWPAMKMGGIEWAMCHMARDCEVPGDWRGSHIYRDPRDIAVSGYFYHQWCDEEWCVQPKMKWGGVSYQHLLLDTIKTGGKEEALMLELEHVVPSVCLALEEWKHWDDPRVINFKYEDAIVEPYGVWGEVAKHLGFGDYGATYMGSLADSMRFEKQTGRELGVEKRGRHLRKGAPGDWRNHFTDKHVDYMDEHWGGLLVNLGYSH